MNMFENLSGRERFLVLVALPLLAAAGLYNFVWVPVSEGRVRAEQEIAGYRMIVETAARTEGMTTGVPVVTVPSGAVAPRVTRSAEVHGLTLSRLEPDADLLRVSVETAQFGDVIDWIAEMEISEGVRLAGIEMDRRPEPGTVAARLTLEPAQ